jgi:hypothetical protein
MRVYVYDLEGCWLKDYVNRGLTADGAVQLRRTTDVVSGKTGWDVLVQSESRSAGENRGRWKGWVSVTEKETATNIPTGACYGLFAKARFERGDIISVKRCGKTEVAPGEDVEKRKHPHRAAGAAVGPTEETVGLGAGWAETVDLNAMKKAASQCCNARFTIDGQVLRATTRILPGTEVIVGVGALPLENDRWKELKWLDVLIWGGDSGIEGKQCIGRVTKFNKSNSMFTVRYEDGCVAAMSLETVERKALHFEDGRILDVTVPLKKRRCESPSI